MDLAIVAKLALGAVLMLALCDAEVRLHFRLRLDTTTIITVAAIWWFS